MKQRRTFNAINAKAIKIANARIILIILPGIAAIDSPNPENGLDGAFAFLSSSAIFSAS